MKHLKKFNESVSESTFEDIFVDLIHQDLKLNIRPSYFSESNRPNLFVSNNYKRTGYIIELSKEINGFNIEDVDNITDPLQECIDRLSEYGVVIMQALSFTNKVFIKYFLIEDNEEETSDKEGFYEFTGMFKNKWRTSNNVTTRALSVTYNKEGIIFSPTNDNISLKSQLTRLKRYLSEVYRRKFYRIGGPNYSYLYDVELEDDKIVVIFKERVDHTH